MKTRRVLMSALVSLSAWAAGISCAATTEKSTGTNWIRCDSDADCRPYPGATCDPGGYCVDESGGRIASGAAVPDSGRTETGTGGAGSGGAPSGGGRSGTGGEPDGAGGGSGGRETEGGLPDGSCRPPGAGGAPARPAGCPDELPSGRACSDLSLRCAYPEICIYDWQPLPVCRCVTASPPHDAGAVPDSAVPVDAAPSDSGSPSGRWECPL